MAPIEIQPASFTSVVEYRGRKIAVHDDVLEVRRQLQEISPQLRLFFMPDAHPPYWQVEQHIPQPDGSIQEQLVLTSVELGSAIVDRVKYIASPNYDLAAEVEKIEAQKAAQREYDFEQEIGERAEKIAWAIRKDTDEKRNF